MTTLAAPLARGLLSWLRRLGRWVIEHLIAHGVANARGYLIGKAADFERRRMALLPQIVAAKKGRRATLRKLVFQHQTLQLRRRLYRGCARWLERNGWQLTDTAVREYCIESAHVLERIPLYSKVERACA